jgi:hypothetical protein
MKKMMFILIVFLFLLLPCRSFAQYFTEQNSGVTVQLTSASASLYNTSTVGWICGYSGTVLKTTSWGFSWVNVSNNGIPNNVNLVNIFGIDANSAITLGYQGANSWVWKTTNGGGNWLQVFSQQGVLINSIWMSSSTAGFMVGNPAGGRWSLWKTTNGGLNWDSTGLFIPQSGSESGFANSISCNVNKIWFGTNNYRIYYSSNNGANWVVQTLATEQNIYTICFSQMIYPSGTGFAGGANLLMTTNNGLNWIPLTTIGSGNITGIAGSFTTVWFTRNNVNIYQSTNSGTSWINSYTAPAGNYLHMSHMKDVIDAPLDISFWAVRSNGGITWYRLVDNIKNLSSNIPENFNLFQNYPNPFNPSTKIKFDIPPSKGARGMTELIIYDALGREAATLVNEQLQSGTYEVEWNGSNYPSGVYFYKLTTADYSETRKMVLVK